MGRLALREQRMSWAVAVPPPTAISASRNEIFAAVRARAFAQLAAACDEATAVEPDAERRLTAIGRAYSRGSGLLQRGGAPLAAQAFVDRDQPLDP